MTGHIIWMSQQSDGEPDAAEIGESPDSDPAAAERAKPGADREAPRPPARPEPRRGHGDNADGRPNTPEIRAAMRRLAAGEPIDRLAAEFGLSAAALRRWREQDRRPAGRPEDRLAALERENAGLRKENERLRLDNYMLEQLLKDRG